MQGFNVLGLNLHDGPHSTDRLAQILKGASKSMDSFKEVELAINALNQRIDGIIIGDSGISLQDYLKRQEADNLYLPKGNYLTKHQDLSNYALKSEIPNIPTKISELLQDIKYLTEHQSLAEYAKKSDIPSLDGYLKEHQDLSEYAKKSDVNDVEILYRALNERIASIENSDSGSNYKFKAYYAIVPGETPTDFKNNISSISNFIELTDQVSELNSEDKEGMIVVLYKKWIPKFNAFDSNLNSWQELDTELKSVSNSEKIIDGESYFVWYNTGATIDKNKIFKIIL